MSKPIKQVGWLIAVIIILVVLTMIFTGIIQMCMTYFANKTGVTISDTILYSVSGTLAIGIAAVILWLIILKYRKLGFYKCPKPSGLTWIAVFILFTFTLCRIVLPGVWAYISGIIGVQPSENVTNSGEPLWMMIAFGVILAPTVEELLFRKDIFSLLLKKFSMTWTIALTSILFAITHGYNLEGFVSCLIAGILFAVLMKQTGSLLACVIAHMLCNLEAFCYNILEKSNSCLIVEFNGYSTYNIAIFAVGLLIMLISTVYLYRCYKRY
jgi:membrane protease YdiL (CAAX protease family)